MITTMTMGGIMSDIERAYALADQYAEITDGYVGINISRYKFPYTNATTVQYTLTAQRLEHQQSFGDVQWLIDMLERLIKECE